MRLRCGKITKREVRRPVQKYVKRITIPRNNNGEQLSNNIGEGTMAAISTEPILSSASTTTILLKQLRQ